LLRREVYKTEARRRLRIQKPFSKWGIWGGEHVPMPRRAKQEKKVMLDRWKFWGGACKQLLGQVKVLGAPWCSCGNDGGTEAEWEDSRARVLGLG
jgi:hypothetical protein